MSAIEVVVIEKADLRCGVCNWNLTAMGYQAVGEKLLKEGLEVITCFLCERSICPDCSWGCPCSFKSICKECMTPIMWKLKLKKRVKSFSSEVKKDFIY